jgi:hypothetical protein
MTERSEHLEVVDKIVVTFDICSSSEILEALLTSDNVKAWRNLLISLKDYLIDKSTEYHAHLYKFTGDGWIMLFEWPHSGPNFMTLIQILSQFYEERFYKDIDVLLDKSPPITGLTFGIDQGKLVKFLINDNEEYVGRAINLACRLQGVIHELDIKEGYRVFVSHRLYNKLQDNFTEYSPDATEKPLKNIIGGHPFRCYRLLVSEPPFRIVEASYFTENNSMDITKRCIGEIRNHKLKIHVTNSFAGGDPDPGVVKQLKIKYMVNGQESEKTVREKAHLELP